MQKYNLMHKNTGRIVDYKDFGTRHSPFLGTADVSKIKKMVGD